MNMRRSSRGPARQQSPNTEKAPSPFFHSGNHNLAKKEEAPFFQAQSNTGVKEEDKTPVQKKGKDDEEKSLQKQSEEKEQPVQKIGADEKKITGNG
jgi:hypothetical protein